MPVISQVMKIVGTKSERRCFDDWGTAMQRGFKVQTSTKLCPWYGRRKKNGDAKVKGHEGMLDVACEASPEGEATRPRRRMTGQENGAGRQGPGGYAQDYGRYKARDSGGWGACGPAAPARWAGPPR